MAPRATKEPKNRSRLSFGRGGEVGNTGLVQYDGNVGQDLDIAMQGVDGLKRLREMWFNHPIIAAGVAAYRRTLGSAVIRVEPGGDTAADIEAAEHVEQCFDDMEAPIGATYNEITTYVPFGFSWMEMVYKRRDGRKPERAYSMRDGKLTRLQTPASSKYDDGRIGWRKWAPRSQESLHRWAFGEHNELLGMWQATVTNPTPVFLPWEKSLHFSTDGMGGNPEGISILRPTRRSYRLGQKIENSEAIGVNRNLNGYPVLTPPMGTDLWDADDETMAALLTEAQNLVTNIRRDEQQGIVKPFGWELELLSTSGTQINTTAILDRLDTRIAMVLLVQFILLGMQRGGAYELAKQQQSLWLTALAGYHLADAEVMNRFAIPRLIDLNDFGELTDYPTVAFSDITTPDLRDLSEAVSKFVTSGALIPGPEMESYLRGQVRAPEEEEPEQEFGREPERDPASVESGTDEDAVEKRRPGSIHYGLSDMLVKAATHDCAHGARDTLVKAAVREAEHALPRTIGAGVRDLIEDELDHPKADDEI